MGCVFFFSLPSFGQYTSRLGRFQVNEIKGCAPFTVIITNANLVTTGECTSGKPCLMDYQGNNQQQQNLFSFTYTTSGVYTLSVLYQSIGSDDIIIRVDQNIPPDFEIYSCSNSRVSIRITDNNYDQYVIDFNNDGTPETIIPSSNNQVATHNYGAPGNFQINVRGRDLNSADNCSPMIKNFTAINTLPIPIVNTLTTLSPTSIQLAFVPQVNIQYRLEIATNNSTTFQLFQILLGVNSVTIPNLNTELNYYCFRLSSYNPCLNTNTYSNPICSQRFTLNIQSGVNRLSWITSTTGISSMQIQRDGVNSTTIPGAPTSFTDVDIVCKTRYCYKITSIYSNGGRSTSLEKCGESFTTATPTPIENATSIVTTNGVDIDWIQNPLFTVSAYSIFRSQHNGFFLPQSPVITSDYKDIMYTTEGIFCYRIDYEDLCDNKSPEGSPICPIRLFGSLGQQNIITLQWSPYVGWKNGVLSYTLEKFNQQGALIQTFAAIADTLFVDDVEDNFQLVSYRVTAIPKEAGISNSKSNEVKLTKSINLFFPTSFTPNGDNLNDTFTVRGKYIDQIELKVFDRWGKLVFISLKDEPWDGTANGTLVQEASYLWTAEIIDQSGQNIKQTGSVLLLKKK